MKVVVAHNAYRLRGGEDAVVASEISLLRRHGHEVIEYRRHNDEIDNMGRLEAAAVTLWSRRTHAEMLSLLRRERPEIVHAHNTFPLISPSLFWAADVAGVPVVQTLHNFRLLCPQAMLLRDGRVCESCVGRAPVAAVRHACYRGSRTQTAVLGSMLMLHRGLGTWDRKVNLYIALNEFCRAKFVQGGLPAERIVVKPNFVDDPGIVETARHGLLFVGRLSPEKGITALAKAAAGLPPQTVRVAGEGPGSDAFDGVPALQRLGSLDPEAVMREMAGAVALVLPSIWYENFPRTLVEAFASGLPVIASRIGALAEIVEDGITGMHVEPGNVGDLAAKMQWALQHPAAMAAMGRHARSVYEARYSADVNHTALMDIYARARV